jgi:hypothetical protein
VADARLPELSCHDAVMSGRLVAAGLLAAAAPVGGQLRLAWTDGSPLQVRGKTYVWCGKWDDGAGVRTLRIQQSSPLSPPWWSLEVRVSIARRGQRIVFPALVGRTGTMFVGYPRKQLEASADAERSRGALTILGDVTCRPGSPVRLSVRGTLAGEQAGGASIRVSGTFTGRIGTTPGPGVNP